MAFQSVLATAECAVKLLLNGVIVTMTHYAAQPVAYDGDDLQAYADAMDEWWFTEMEALLSVDVAYQGVEVRGLELLNDQVREADAFAGQHTNTGEPFPNSVAFCIKRISGLTGRSARGRVYIPGVSVNSNDSNENFVTQGFADAVIAAHNDQVTYLSGTGWTPVIVSRYTNGALRIDQGELLAVTFPIQTWTYTNLRLDSRRDRMPGT